MPRSWLAALAIGVLALLTLFVLLPDDEADRLEGPLGVPTTEQTEAEAASLGDAPAEAADATQPAERAEVANAAEPELTSVELETYKGANGTLVTVVDKESGEPVASASLLVCLREEIEEDALERALVSGTETLENIMRKYGHHYQTGPDGKVMVQPLTDYPMLYARLGNRSGFAYQIEPGESEVEVLIEPDLRMQVEVVDERGARVARAPVALRMISDDYQFTLFTRDTDEQGVLVFENMRPYIMSTIGGNARLELTVAALVDPDELTDQQRVVLNDAAFEEGKAVLVLPPTGRVLVRTTLPDGELFEGEGTVQIRSSGASRENFGPPTGMSRPLIDGVAEFPHVVLGLDLIAEAFIKNAPGPDAGEGPGPSSAQATTEIEIQRTLRPIVRARLLDAAGEVLRETTFRTSLGTRHERSTSDRGSSSRTDAEGWFEIELEPMPLDAPTDYRRSLRLIHQGMDLSESEARLDLSHRLRLGVNDFGDLQLAPSKVILAGRVVDQFDQPIAHASVMLQQARLGRDNEVRGWRSVRELQTRSAVDGRFVIQRELPEAQQFRLQVQALKFETYEQEIQPVGQEVEVRLHPGSFISGSVLFDAEIDPSRMRLNFVESEHNTDSVRLRPIPGEEGKANFEYQAHPDTPYQLVLESEAGEVLHQQEGVSTQRGETSTPPGLQPLDLRGRMRIIELKAVDTLGKPVDATFILRATEDSWNSKQAENGIVALPIARELFEVTVQHAQHASVTLQRVSQNQLIRLEPALEITVQVPQQFLHEEGMALSVQMYPEDRSRGRIYAAANRQDVDDQGQATLYAPQPGAYRVSLMLFYEDGNRHRTRSISAGTIQVSSHGSVHPLHIDPDRFQDAVTKLKQEN